MLDLLLKLEDEGYIRSVKHTQLPLTVFNYTPKTQFESAWGDYPILRKCRGLILDNEGEIIGRPFEKFHNWEELKSWELPSNGDKIEITEKMDGSLLIVCRYGDDVVYSTRGSFYSDQCIDAQKIFRAMYDENWIEAGKTYLFEYVGPSNRIVVNYDEHDLIHLAIIDNKSGLDLPRDSRFNLVPVFSLNGGIMGDELYTQLKSLDMSNKEGFVIRQISDGSYPDFRVKIKYENYVFLHSILTNLSTVDVWEKLKAGETLDDILDVTPDEFNEFIKKTKKELENAFELIELRSKTAYNLAKTKETRKDQAVYINSEHKDVSAVVFKMLDSQSYSDIIWKMIKPKRLVPFNNSSYVDDEGKL